ncbi:hypothetical protein AV530_003250 [Patagioenas fasciata monilis]|uniref:Uncharacterized protein n=1 Tax=Patagioenas fasciata monilis TaxID=372326 RepID=A0A1V4K3F3_PATFA|nr:hypothetical protein AV530_003250 [Patagioenas fasciata monilis]
MPRGWPPVPSPNPGENSESRGLESDDSPKEPAKAENAKVVNKAIVEVSETNKAAKSFITSQSWQLPQACSSEILELKLTLRLHR